MRDEREGTKRNGVDATSVRERKKRKGKKERKRNWGDKAGYIMYARRKK